MQLLNKTIPVTMALLLALSGLSRADEATDDFFEFTERPLPAPEFVSFMRGQDADTIVFQSVEVDAGFYRINEQQLERVELKDGQPFPTAIKELPASLPNPGAVTLSGGELYVAGGSVLLKLAPDEPETGWVECAAPPESLGANPVMAVQGGTLYITGAGEAGARSFAYNPISGVWKTLSAADEDMRGFVGTACGNDHLVYFNAAVEDDRILAYHRITDEWFEIGSLPKPVKALAAVSDGNLFVVYSSAAIIEGLAVLQPTAYHYLNHFVVVALLLAIIGIGVMMSRREKSAGDYFRAGNRIPWWAAGLSMFAALASAISLMSMPGKGYSTDWIYFSISIFTVLIQLPILLIYYVPLARRLKVSTANEYLERRFGLPARMLGFVFFSLNQVLIRVGAILLLPSLALNSIFGLPLTTCILIMGGVTIIFVTLGGLEAVVWADVLQAVVMVIAILTCTIWALSSLDLVPSQAMEILHHQDKLKLFDFRMDMSSPVVVVLAANILAFALGMIGDQNFIQRVQCTSSENESRKAMITQLAVAVPLNLILFVLGTLLFLYYKTQPEVLNPALKPEGVFPFFAAQNLPVGLPGVVVAALLAATISTVAAALNSVANLGVEDVYRRFNKNASDHHSLILGRVLTVTFGIIGTGFALWIASTNRLDSVWDLSFILMGYVLAPLTGIYVLGIFTKRANASGAWVGALAGVLACFLAKKYLHLNSLAYLPFVMFTCIVVGYLASLVLPSRKVDLAGLTAYTLLDKDENE